MLPERPPAHAATTGPGRTAKPAGRTGRRSARSSGRNGGTVDLHVSLDGRRDLAGQVYRQIRAAILDGRLVPGDALPSTRELAVRLALSRNTVGIAYDRLTAEGFVAGRPGVGT